MKSFWLLCLLGGVFAFIAPLLARRKGRFFKVAFGNRGARIFCRLLGFSLVVLGLYMGRENQSSLTERPPYEIVVLGAFPGHDALVTSEDRVLSWVARRGLS